MDLLYEYYLIFAILWFSFKVMQMKQNRSKDSGYTKRFFLLVIAVMLLAFLPRFLAFSRGAGMTEDGLYRPHNPDAYYYLRMSRYCLGEDIGIRENTDLMRYVPEGVRTEDAPLLLSELTAFLSRLSGCPVYETARCLELFLPQLVVIDGGEGQLEFARQALAELGLLDRLMVVGLAKRMELVILINDPYPLFLDRNSHALKVLMQIRDEAHRFGITFHRSLRSKGQIQSALRGIKGVGEQTESRLLMHYGSVARIAAASLEDLSTMVSPALAKTILEELNKEFTNQ